MDNVEALKWEKRFQRERASRKEAEKLLEDKSRELFDLNESLKERVRQEVAKNAEKEKFLAEQARLSSMGEMIGNIAHQWRQPLSSITTSASGIELQNEIGILTSEELTDTLKHIIERANYLSKTIDDFRDFFKTNDIKEEFQINDIIRSIKNIIYATYQNENIILLIDIIDNPKIIGLPGQLSQVLLNIFNNARDMLLERKEKNRIVKVDIYSKNKNIIIKIHDNAGGVDKNIKPKIFEPYFTTKHQAQGTGIGLYMSRQIVHNHFLGQISVENKNFNYKEKEEFGACFTISFPNNIDKEKN